MKKKINLDQLLQSIDPSVVLEVAKFRTDEALNSFYCNKGAIADWEEWKHLMIRFMVHVESFILRLKPLREPEWVRDWEQVRQLLIRIYGSNGEKAAFEMSHTGNDGGLYKVLKDLAEEMADEFSQNEIKAKINSFWCGLSTDGQFDAMNEYLVKYGHMLPSELTEKSAVRIKANFPKVLEEHPRLIEKLHRIGV